MLKRRTVQKALKKFIIRRSYKISKTQQFEELLCFRDLKISYECLMMMMMMMMTMMQYKSKQVAI
jgi:hypothetical protein